MPSNIDVIVRAKKLTAREIQKNLAIQWEIEGEKSIMAVDKDIRERDDGRFTFGTIQMQTSI